MSDGRKMAALWREVNALRGDLDRLRRGDNRLLASALTERDKARAEAERLRQGLWWLAEELSNDADAIEPVPDLAESAIRHRADVAHALRRGCSYFPLSSSTCARGSRCCHVKHDDGEDRP